MGSVNITESNGQLGGIVTIADGVMSMVMTGASESGGYTVDTPILITSLADLATNGITLANNPFCYKHVTEFYNEAPVGNQLYLMLVAHTLTVANMCDNTNANGGKKLLNFAQGKIKVFGAISDDAAIVAAGGTVTVTAGLNGDVYTAAANAKTMEAAFRALQMPFRAIIGGSSYSGTASALTDESTGTTNNKAAIVVGDTQIWDATNCSACLGLVMGKIAASAVQEKISKVKNGPLSNTAAYLKGTTVETAGGDPATIAGKNFITWRTFPDVSGYFFSGDPMLTVSTDDYSVLARCRVIDKAHVITYKVFAQEVDDNIPTVDGFITVGGNQVAAGLPDPGWAAHMQQTITDQLSKTMVSVGNCDGVSCFINPSQDVRGTGILNVAITIDSEGYLSTIDIALGY